MSEQVAHTETDEETGLTLKLIVDEDSSRLDPTDPDNDEAQNDTRFVVLHNSYQNPAERWGLNTVEDVAAFEAENAAPDAPWYHIPLWMIDHSGTAYRVGQSNPFSCPWDSGRVGIVALKRSEWGDGSDASLREIAESICSEYTAWANGEAYGYVIEDADGDEVPDGSCWGFLGYDYAMSEAREAFDHAKQAARESGAAALVESRPDLYA